MIRITEAYLSKAIEHQRLKQRLGLLGDFLLAQDLSHHQTTLSRLGTCLLLYDNTTGEGDGKRFAGLPRGWSLPVRWVRRSEPNEEDDLCLPKDIRATAVAVRQALEADGADALSNTKTYVIKRIRMLQGFDLSSADLLFTGDSCALSLAVGLTTLFYGGETNPGVLMSGAIDGDRLSEIVVGGKKHVLDTCQLPAASLLVSPGSHLPPGDDHGGIRQLPNYIEGQTLREQMAEALSGTYAEPPAGKPEEWLTFLNTPAALLFSNKKRQALYDEHLVAHMTTLHEWRDLLSGERIEASEVVGDKNAPPSAPFLTSWNPRNIPLTRQLALSYRPKEICLLADVKESEETLLANVLQHPPFDTIPTVVIRHEANSAWSATRDALHQWIVDHPGCNVELMPGSILMTTILLHATRGTSARLFNANPPDRGRNNGILFQRLTFSALSPAGS